jgi:hypothetical protein
MLAEGSAALQTFTLGQLDPRCSDPTSIPRGLDLDNVEARKYGGVACFYADPSSSSAATYFSDLKRPLEEANGQATHWGMACHSGARRRLPLTGAAGMRHEQ